MCCGVFCRGWSGLPLLLAAHARSGPPDSHSLGRTRASVRPGAATERSRSSRRPGARRGTLAGVLLDNRTDRLGQVADLGVDAGVDEIMFGRIPNDPQEFQRIEEEIIAAFD